MREKRQVLVDKHDETRRNADTLNIGGGISLWPDMEDMRLTRAEYIKLCLLLVLLVVFTCIIFETIRGKSLLTFETIHGKYLLTFETIHGNYLLSFESIHGKSTYL